MLPFAPNQRPLSMLLQGQVKELMLALLAYEKRQVEYGYFEQVEGPKEVLLQSFLISLF
jgi:hypothetical protein